MIKYIATALLFPAMAYAATDISLITFNMPFLIFVGLALIVAEFLLPTKGLLGFAGIALFFCGTYSLADHPNPDLHLSWPVIIALDLIVIGTTLALAILTYKGYNAKNTEVTDSVISKEAKVIDWNETTGNVEIGGVIWKAVHASPASFQRGDKVIVSAQHNLTLTVISQGENQ